MVLTRSPIPPASNSASARGAGDHVITIIAGAIDVAGARQRQGLDAVGKRVAYRGFNTVRTSVRCRTRKRADRISRLAAREALTRLRKAVQVNSPLAPVGMLVQRILLAVPVKVRNPDQRPTPPEGKGVGRNLHTPHKLPDLVLGPVTDNRVCFHVTVKVMGPQQRPPRRRRPP